jgi:uncharacterized membrane protein (Fun14 family)
MNINRVSTVPMFPQKAGWFNVVKDKLNLKMWLGKMNLTTDRVIEIASYLGIGFILGFLLKRSFKYFIIAICVTGLVICGLHSIGAINWEIVKAYFRVQPMGTVNSVFAQYLEWVKSNLSMVITILIGFFIGFKIG